jgi:hypothetical protein
VQPVTNEQPIVEKNDKNPCLYNIKVSIPNEYEYHMKDKFLSIYNKIIDLGQLTKEEFTQIEAFSHNEKLMIIKNQNECIHVFLRDLDFLSVKSFS